MAEHHNQAPHAVGFFLPCFDFVGMRDCWHGESIQVHPVSSLSGRPRDESILKFKGVALYHFVHSDGAIITDVEEVPVDLLLDEKSDFISARGKSSGVRHWRQSLDEYRQYLNEHGYKAWKISSAIGFDGFVIAQSLT